MRRVLADMRAFGTEYLRNPVGAFFAFAFPVILILIFGAVFSTTEGTTFSLEVQDLDGTPMSAAAVENLTALDVLEIALIPESVDIETYIKDNSLSRALVIPEGFEEGVLTGNMSQATFLLYGDPSQSSFGAVHGSVQGAATIMNFNLTGAFPIIGTDTRPIVAEEFSYIDFFLPGMIGFTVMINTLFVQSAVSAEYRTRGFFKLLATTPMRKAEWLLSKVLWTMLIMFISVALLFLVSIGVYGTQVALTWIAVAHLVAGIVLFVAMGLLIGVLARGVESASAVANAVGFPMMFLSGTFFPLEMMPDLLQKIALVLPLTYTSEGLRDTMIYGNDVDALWNLAVVVILAIVFFVATTRLMSWKER